MTTALFAVVELVHCIARELDVYRSSTHKEAQVRGDCVEPFFLAHGRRIDSRRGDSARQREAVWKRDYDLCARSARVAAV